MTHCYVHAFRSKTATPLGYQTLGTKSAKSDGLDITYGALRSF